MSKAKNKKMLKALEKLLNRLLIEIWLSVSSTSFLQSDAREALEFQSKRCEQDFERI